MSSCGEYEYSICYYPDSQTHITCVEQSPTYTIRNEVIPISSFDGRSLICYQKPVRCCDIYSHCCTKCIKCCTNCITMDLGPNDAII
ncbi:hypothetical protein I4U23_027377 [Adineta vaga]|nr:hypothetical protein I4U23_027377 [Adineta vaga]